MASVADQATLSGANFAVNVLLARWLTSEGYGAFSVAASMTLILAALHNALILEPMTVVGPSEFATRLRSYLKLVTELNLATVFLLGALAAVVAIFYRSPTVRDALAALGLALPGYLLLLTCRREQYIIDKPIRSLYLSIAYACLLVTVIVTLHAIGQLAPWNAVLASGVAFAVSFWAMTRRNLPKDFQPSAHSLAEISNAHWHYGRWLFFSALLGVGISDLQVLLLSKLMDLKSAGVLRALVNFILPVGQLLTVLSVFSLPKLARRMREDGYARGLRFSALYSSSVILIALAYSGTLLLIGSPLEHFLYGGRMAAYVVYLPWLAATVVLSGVAIAFTTPLRAAHNSQHTLFAGITATAAGIAASLTLVPRFQLEGALMSLVLANAASAAVVVGTYFWMLRKNPAAEASQDRIMVIFDENLTSTSPVGSCLLKVVRDNASHFPLHVFYNRLDSSKAEVPSRTFIPLPPGPVILRSVLFTLFSAFANWAHFRGITSFRIAAQGVFPFSQISYAQFCHRIFLRDHRPQIGGGPLRRAARYLIHIWGAITERMAFKRARSIVVPSQGLAYELQTAYPELVAGKINIIPNPVDTNQFRKPDDFKCVTLRSELGCQPHDLLLSFCALGNFERKGLRYAVQALAELHTLTVRLVVVGGSASEIREYEKICADLKVDTNLRFVGMQQDIRPYLWSSDAFLFPSSYEAFPLVCLQAAAAGLPLIATNVYGVQEFMVDQKTGWLVDRNAKAIASAINQALMDRARLRAMGLTARERVQEYSEQIFCARWRSLLDKLWDETAQP